MERRNTEEESDNDRKSLQSSGNTNRYTSRPSITSHSQILSDGPSILRNPLPIWAAPITMREDSFRDEDLINSSLHSFTANPVAVGLNQSKTITGTFRPSLEDMVDVNMSAHGKNFQTSFTNRASRSRNNRRRFSVFSVFSEDMEYDDVTTTKSQLFDITLSKLLYVLVSITLSLALLVALFIFNKNSNNGDSIPNYVPSVKQGFSGKPDNDCGIHSNFENNAFLQCECNGHIFMIAESKVQSCDSSNVALVWLAGDSYTNQTEFFDRYMLALLYSAWKGYYWNHQDLWLDSQKSHCEWYGVVCDSRQRTIDLLLGDNNLQGRIPPEIAAFYSLRTIDISGNYVEGRIPRELGDCHALQTLRLSGNKFSFSIPTELAFLTNLVSLELDHNHLAGTIPTEIMELYLLNLIDLSWNNLFGTIPKEVIYLQNCREFKAQSNQLTGINPLNYSGMNQLLVFELSNNTFNE